jgi:hypothetical protein
MKARSASGPFSDAPGRRSEARWSKRSDQRIDPEDRDHRDMPNGARSRRMDREAASEREA